MKFDSISEIGIGSSIPWRKNLLGTAPIKTEKQPPHPDPLPQAGEGKLLKQPETKKAPRRAPLGEPWPTERLSAAADLARRADLLGR